MLHDAGPDLQPDVWVGIVTMMPWILLYLRGFIGEYDQI